MRHLKTVIVGLLQLCHGGLLHRAVAQASGEEELRVVVESRGWRLVGDLRLPASAGTVPAVLMLNRAAGDRTVYRELAHQLAVRGIASLRLDLAGHGESVNLGRFVPGEADSVDRDVMIWASDIDVAAAHRYLKAHPGIDSTSIGMIGASYSGEETAEAGRASGHAQAYVQLSPGSFSEASVAGIDSTGVPWLFIVSNNERHLREITASVQATSRTVELLILPGVEHATRILETRPDMSERIAVWLRHHLR